MKTQAISEQEITKVKHFLLALQEQLQLGLNWQADTFKRWVYL